MKCVGEKVKCVFERKEKEDDAANAAEEDTTMLCIVDDNLDLLTP